MFSIVLYFSFTILLTKTGHMFDYVCTLLMSPEHRADVHEDSKVGQMLALAPGPVLPSLQSLTPGPVPCPEERELGDQDQRKPETDLSTESQKTHSTELSEYSRPEKMCSKVISTEMLETDLLTLFS